MARAPAANGRDYALLRVYLLAKERIIEAGFEPEIAWQEQAAVANMTPQLFFREAAWVVFSAGMREAVIRCRFPLLQDVFHAWEPLQVAERSAECRRRGLAAYNHAGKIDAVISIARTISEQGVDTFASGLSAEGPRFLARLPYIGRVTCNHLAKNLGYAVAKPDRHLERMARLWGYKSVGPFCDVIAEALEEPVQVVDLVMWRYATIEGDYVNVMRRAVEQAERYGRAN